MPTLSTRESSVPTRVPDTFPGKEPDMSLLGFCRVSLWTTRTPGRLQEAEELPAKFLVLAKEDP